MGSEGKEVRTLVDDRELAGERHKHRFTWDGRDDDGGRVPDGVYRMRVLRRDEGRVIDSIKEIRVDRRPPARAARLGHARGHRSGRAGPAPGGARSVTAGRGT